MPLKIVIPGGAGHVGHFLARALHDDGHAITVLSRRPHKSPWKTVWWNGTTPGPWESELDGSDVVINLAGRSVNCRYGAGNRRAILESRVESTRAIGRAVAHAAHPPKVWLQASTATIYAHRFDQPNDEATGIIGGHEPDAPDTWRFSIDVATKWEQTFNNAIAPVTRKVAMRSAMTMAPERGGVFDAFASLVRRGLGGNAGDGRQFVSWIHYRDFTAAIRWLIRREDIDGAVNLAAPHPLPNAAFMRELRRAAGRRVGLPINRWMLEAGAIFMRTETELILKSRRVVPRRLIDSGFRFEFPCWKDAAPALYREWRYLSLS